jgi:hypothetical protein
MGKENDNHHLYLWQCNRCEASKLNVAVDKRGERNREVVSKSIGRLINDFCSGARQALGYLSLGW